MPTTPRRWFAFRLRTLLLLIVPLCAVLAWWVRAQFDWIAERHEFLSSTTDCALAFADGEESFRRGLKTRRAKTPVQLRLFGERAIKEIYFREGTDPLFADRAKVLFPEAAIGTFGP
jgi:hypothetical protein